MDVALISLFLGVVAAFFWGVADVGIVKLSKKIDVYAMLFFKTLLTVVFLLPMYILFRGCIYNINELFYAGIFGVVAYFAFYHALKLSPISAVFSGSVGIFVIIAYSVLVFGEVLSVAQIIASVLVVIGVMLFIFKYDVSFHQKVKWDRQSALAVLFAIIASLLWSAEFYYLKIVLMKSSVYDVMLLFNVFMLLPLILLIWFRRKSIRLGVDAKAFKEVWLFLGMIAIAEIFAYWVYLYATKHAYLSLTAVGSSLAPVFGTLFIGYFTKRHIHKQELFAGLLILVGVLLVSVLG